MSDGREHSIADHLLSKEMKQKEVEDQQNQERTDEHHHHIKPIRLLASLCVVIGVSISWACSTQFRKIAMADVDATYFYAPYAMIWFSTTFMFLCYPVFMLYICCCTQHNIYEQHQYALGIFSRKGSTKFSVLVFCTGELLFLVIWTVTNYAYAVSLAMISASAASSIMTANTAIVCVLGWLILKEAFNIVKVLAVLLAIVGVVIVSLDREFAGQIIGILLVIISAGFSALYKVLFKLLNGSATLGQVSLFMSALGAFNFVLNAIPVAILKYFNLEIIVWDYIPWLPLLGVALLGLVFNFLVNFGIVLLDPLVISIGMVFGIPLSAGIDIIFRSMHVTSQFLVGSALITLSFLLIAFPVERTLRRRFNLVCCYQR